MARARQDIVGGSVDKSTTGVVNLTVLLSGQTVGFCSGALIAPNLVLTARHCISQMNQEQIQCGVTAFTTVSPPGQIFVSPATIRPRDPAAMFRVSSVLVPPGTSEFCGQDIALLVLSGAGVPSTVTPIVPRIDVSAAAGETFAADGFGLTAPDAQAPDGVRMRVDGNAVECKGLDCRWAGDLIRASEWSSLDAPTCSGDSGSPALDGHGRAFGVDSRGPWDCAGAIYTDVASWKDFLVSTALDAAKAGGYPAPFWTGGSSLPATPPGGDSGVLGTPCTADCGGGYACYSASGSPPGICVPHCSASQSSCPNGYTCSQSLGACVPSASRSRDSGGCTVARDGVPRGQAGWALVLVALVLAARQGRGRVITTTCRSGARTCSWKRRSAGRSGGAGSVRPSHSRTAR